MGMFNAIIPDDLYHDHQYDKWGNLILANGTRTKGPLFNDLSVQAVLARSGATFTDWVKYPRTWHLPWSPGATDDDKVLRDTSAFIGQDVVATLKMDGENFTGYRDYCHARSVDGRSHPSRAWAKSFWFQRAHELPERWRAVSENLYAQHSIPYHDLQGYLYGISIWTDDNICLSWDETVEWFTEVLRMPMVEVLYRGPWDEKAIRELHHPRNDHTREGYVVRVADRFPYGAFSRSVAKYVRPDHVTTDGHWMHGKATVPNGLRSD